VHRASGPFVLPARIVLLTAGIMAAALAFFNLFHEFHAAEVDALYTVVASIVVLLWLGSLILAFLGFRAGIFVAGAIAFIEFGVVASSHFVSGAAALDLFVNKEGLALAAVDIALIPACALVVMSAAVCWSNPRGRTRNLSTLSLLAAAVLGSVLVILQATDDLSRADFGSATPEDGAFAAAVLASAWIAGGLWIARVRRSGALIIALATFGVWYSFITLHLLKGGTSMSEIVSKTGSVWAVIAVAAAVVAGASFLVSVGLLVLSLVQRKSKSLAGTSQPLRRGA
jgi:hypothetical protein